MSAKIKKNDTVVVLTGRDKGRSGKVLEVRPAEDRVLVEGVNMAKRHTKPSVGVPNGGVISKEAPIHISNVAVRDPKTGKPTRIGFKWVGEGAKRRKVRIAKASGVEIDV
ncbi:MAG: 50S ribosomal protein L24 [Terricaulis silvestris]